jgi:hypothetical protein
MYEIREKKNKNIIQVQVDFVHTPSMIHKYGAIKNKAQVFEDRRFKKPKHKKLCIDD